MMTKNKTHTIKFGDLTFEKVEVKIIEPTLLDVRLDQAVKEMHRKIEDAFRIPSFHLETTTTTATESVLTVDKIQRMVKVMTEQNEAYHKAAIAPYVPRIFDGFDDDPFPTLPEDKPKPEPKFKSWPYPMDDE